MKIKIKKNLLKTISCNTHEEINSKKILLSEQTINNEIVQEKEYQKYGSNPIALACLMNF